MLEVRLVPLGPFPAQRLSRLARGLEHCLEVPATPDMERLQTHSSADARVLGVTEADMFIPVLTFVFGEAQLGGRAAVVSTYRLRNEVYGLQPDPRLLEERLLKEAMHELGHTFGLLHCHHTECVMQASTYAESVDLKPAAYCGSCRKQHEAFLNSSALEFNPAQSPAGHKPEKVHELLK